MARKPDDAPRELLVLKLLPNFVSILALCSGLTAIRYAIAGNFTLAVLLIGVAAALDGLDGRLARYKWPRRWLRVDALSKTALGKVQKAELQRQVSDRPAAGASP